MPCPDYYMLASGREFIDFTRRELTAWLSPRVSPEVWHCIVSAMEHRYRCGLKEGETETDKAAEEWWLDKGKDWHYQDLTDSPPAELYDTDYDWDSILAVTLMMVDLEKTRKLSHL